MRQRVLTALPVASAWRCSSARSRSSASSFAPVGWHQIAGAIADVPVMRLGAALVLTALNYLVLTGYDLLAFKYIGRACPPGASRAPPSWPTPSPITSGFAMFSGASVRYRFYTRWGVTPDELSRIIFSYSVTFWLGLSRSAASAW